MPNQTVINGLQEALNTIELFEHQELTGQLEPANINDIAMLIGQTNILLTHILKTLLKIQTPFDEAKPTEKSQ